MLIESVFNIGATKRVTSLVKYATKMFRGLSPGCLLRDLCHHGFSLSAMEMSTVSFINDLDVSRDDYTLRVRIIRLWRQPMFKNPSQTFSIEMILIDEQGNKIQASVLHKWFTRFERFLVEKATLIIKKPTLGDNSAAFRYIDNPLKVCLYFNTTVSTCSDFTGPLYGFSFTHFQSILDREVSEFGSIDVIGMLVRYFKLEDIVTKNGKPASKLNFQIRDLSGLKISVTLWDSYAKQLFEYLQSNPEATNVVIILQFGKFRRFKDAYSVSNSYNVSRLFIDSDIDEINDFKKCFLENNGKESSLTVGLPASSLLVNLKEDFLIRTEFNRIAEVNDIVQVKSVIVVGYVKLIIPDVEWFYQSCKYCMKKVVRLDANNTVVGCSNVVEETILYGCPSKCFELKQIAIVPRFKIPIRVQDSTGIVSLTVFDREAKKFMKTNAEQLFDDYVQGGEMCVYPEVFNTLLDRKFAFKIDITTFNLENNYKFFGVSKMTDDVSIISELEKKYHLEQGPLSDSLNLSSQDYKSHDTSCYKDVVSFTGDNETPVSIPGKSISTMNTDDGKQLLSKNSQGSLKRTLVEVYDIDEMDISSATKPAKKDAEKKCFEITGGLLIPKLEK